MECLIEIWKRRLAAALVVAVASATGCTYLQNRGRDTLDMFDLGFTFSTKPQFGIYANCPFTVPGGYSKVDGYYAGLGGGKLGVMEHHQDAAGLLFWGHEDIKWGEGATDAKAKGDKSLTIRPLGIVSDSEGNPSYRPQCAHYLHLGFVGITVNLNYREWGDFFLGWFGLDINKDDWRSRGQSPEKPDLADMSARLSYPRAGLQLFIRMEKDTFAPDEPIAIDVRLYNRTGMGFGMRDRPRDVAVYYEPFAKTPKGELAEWLFKFHVFQHPDGRVRYRSPQFDIPAEQRGDYYHYITLPPGSFVGQRFELPRARTGNWLRSGTTYVALATYEVSPDFSYVILNRELTTSLVEKLGTDAAYARLWNGRLYSNLLAFTIAEKRTKLFGLF